MVDKEELYFSDETPAASSPSESGRRRSERRTAGARRGRPDGSASSASEQVPVKLAFPGNDFEGRDTGAGGWHACLCAFFLSLSDRKRALGPVLFQTGSFANN